MTQISKPDKHSLFANHELFRHFTPAEIDRLIGFSRVQRFEPNEVIFAKGAPGYGLMAVLSGRVKISSLSPDGREVVFNLIGPGEVFGEIALLDGKERTADATAVAECELLILDRRDFVPFLERNPDVCLRLIAVLCERLRHTTEQVEDVLFLNLDCRLAKTLLQLAEAHGQSSPSGVALDLKLSQRDLASMIGASRESVNRQLALWQKAGFVALDHGSITICDQAELERILEAEAGR